MIPKKKVIWHQITMDGLIDYGVVIHVTTIKRPVAVYFWSSLYRQNSIVTKGTSHPLICLGRFIGRRWNFIRLTREHVTVLK